MEFNAWELVALEVALEKAIDNGHISALNGGLQLLKRLQNEKPSKTRKKQRAV